MTTTHEKSWDTLAEFRKAHFKKCLDPCWNHWSLCKSFKEITSKVTKLITW